MGRAALTRRWLAGFVLKFASSLQLQRAALFQPPPALVSGPAVACKNSAPLWSHARLDLSFGKSPSTTTTTSTARSSASSRSSSSTAPTTTSTSTSFRSSATTTSSASIQRRQDDKLAMSLAAQPSRVRVSHTTHARHKLGGLYGRQRLLASQLASALLETSRAKLWRHLAWRISCLGIKHLSGYLSSYLQKSSSSSSSKAKMSWCLAASPQHLPLGMETKHEARKHSKWVN